MRHEVIVCTKDRPVELTRCLDALERQDDPPDRVLIIDSSLNIEALLDRNDPLHVVHLSATPGLTRQRNVGLGLLRPDTEIVHFLDDDAVPEPGYLREMNAALAKHSEAVGAGATITNLPTHKPWTLECLFGLNSRRQGALLKSGVNILSFDGHEYRTVDWLSGCCMSYRVNQISGLYFDERRTGNGLGEDVDFSARARSRGPLIWSPTARVAHVQSPVNRDVSSSLVRRDVLHRWHLATDGVGGVKRSWVMYSTIGYMALNLGRALRGRSRPPMVSAKASMLGLLDLARRRPL